MDRNRDRYVDRYVDRDKDGDGDGDNNGDIDAGMWTGIGMVNVLHMALEMGIEVPMVKKQPPIPSIPRPPG